MRPTHPQTLDRPTERQLRCPHCKVPRFLGAASGTVTGTLRIPCPKCRADVVFDLASGATVATVLDGGERELRCGKCVKFLAGVVVTDGRGRVRVPCIETACKRDNPFEVSRPAPRASVPVS